MGTLMGASRKRRGKKEEEKGDEWAMKIEMQQEETQASEHYFIFKAMALALSKWRQKMN